MSICGSIRLSLDIVCLFPSNSKAHERYQQQGLISIGGLRLQLKLRKNRCVPTRLFQIQCRKGIDFYSQVRNRGNLKKRLVSVQPELFMPLFKISKAFPAKILDSRLPPFFFGLRCPCCLGDSAQQLEDSRFLDRVATDSPQRRIRKDVSETEQPPFPNGNPLFINQIELFIGCHSFGEDQNIAIQV